MIISGATRVAGVIGSPVRHSLSPALHNAAFAACDLDWTYVAFEVAPGRAAAALDGMRTLGLAGLSVTMPHKADVAAAVDELSPAAGALAAVNTVVRDSSGRLVGHNTDGAGFIASLVDAGVDPEGMRCVVLGAGGAGRAVVDALGRAGAAEVAVVNRTPDRSIVAAGLAGATGRVGAVDDIGTADLVVNATPVGMASDPSLPDGVERLRRGQVIVDLVYEPVATPLLVEAERRGATVVSGIGMLVHQAALQFRLWTNVEPPLAVMRRAAEEELKSRT